ncbi:MAG: D-alanyl-D-alanine carboxypeptidase [Gammaproteobacteria bacterium]|nr:D-alanyl-D-alanine carboxypeptidase [Gammaproteobacteria bacterium]
MNIHRGFYSTLACIFMLLSITTQTLYAESLPSRNIASPPAMNKHPVITPTPPTINAKAYILIDVDSGKVIAEKNSELRLPPASLTKLMTLYVVSQSLKSGQIHLTDPVHISQKAWKTGGSRMFIREGQDVPVEELLKGVIVDSGNDACVALAEHIGSSESTFTGLMNQQAKNLKMDHSNFTDSTGLPHDELYTTGKDLAILGRALIRDFPEYYHWYKQKWFTYNNIRQPNRNRLLWRDNTVDGMKTGHTDKAGYCLVSSAKRGDMRLLAVVLNAPTDSARADDSQRLLNYGFRFFETHQLFHPGQAVTVLPLYKSTLSSIRLGVLNENYVTVPSGQYQHLSIVTNVPGYIEAPVKKGQQIGELMIKFDNKTLETQPLYALEDAAQAGFFTRVKDSIRLLFHRWFG